MAKKKVVHEKVIDKKVNLSSLLIALVLFAVAAFGYTTLSAADLDVLGIKFNISAEEITALFSGYIFAKDVVGLIFVLLCSIFSLVVMIKLIVMFFKLFGFFGKKDVEVMKKKLAKYAKSAFAALGMEITVLVIASYDNGALSQNAALLMILTGVLFFALYGLTRYYRWFVLEKRYWLDCLFEGLKDALFIACPIFLLTMIDGRFLGTFADDLYIMYGQVTAEYLSAKQFSIIFGNAATIVLMFLTLGLMRKTMKLMVFNNYKKSAYQVKGRYIALFVIAFLFAAFSPVIKTLATESFSTDVIAPALLSALVSALPYLFAMVGICIGSAINEKETAKVEYEDDETEENAETAATPETVETPVAENEEAPIAEIAATEENAAPTETAEEPVVEETPVAEEPVAEEEPNETKTVKTRKSPQRKKSTQNKE